MASEPSTYHLWLKPAGDVFEELAATIRDLAGELNGPVFEPHVTLLSLKGTDKELHVRATTDAAGRLEPIPIAFTGLSHGTEYFKCLFATVQETSQVLNAHAVARDVCDGIDAAYLPHLSLLYGHYPGELKSQIVERLRHRLPGPFVAKAIHLIRADSRDPKDWHDVFAAPMGPP